MCQMLSQSVRFCRLYIKKHFGVFFRFTVYTAYYSLSSTFASTVGVGCSVYSAEYIIFQSIVCHCFDSYLWRNMVLFDVCVFDEFSTSDRHCCLLTVIAVLLTQSANVDDAVCHRGWPKMNFFRPKKTQCHFPPKLTRLPFFIRKWENKTKRFSWTVIWLDCHC